MFRRKGSDSLAKKFPHPEFNHEQQAAYNAIMSGRRNVFLTGNAGTGKSYVLEKALEDLDRADHNTLRCAPTGIAAINIGGITLHKMLGLKPKDILVGNSPYKVPFLLKHCEMIVVDEISMCRSDLFSWLVKCIDLANKDRRCSKDEKRKHPIKLIVVGDFCQLPPVVTGAEQNFFETGEEYAFMTPEWQEMNFENCVLMQTVRQDNQDFITALNQIRMGDSRGVDYINQFSAKQTQQQAITIASRNQEVAAINNKMAQKFANKAAAFKASVDGRINVKNVPSEKELVIAPGEYVVFTANQKVSNDKLPAYYNGSEGVIKEVHDNYLIVDIVGGGKTIVMPYTWSQYEYVVKDVPIIDKYGRTIGTVRKLVKQEIGSFTQFPVKLGYAMTVHKSQGKTLSRANIIPAGWMSGLLYVALSRVTDVSNIYLKHPLHPYMVKLDPLVKNFYKAIMSGQDFDPEQIEDSKQIKQSAKQIPDEWALLTG